MPKFTSREKELIRQKLLDTGRQLFPVLGLRKTSVEDLTKACGIAQGSFYLFFSSKEELYTEIMQEEERIFHDRMRARFSAEGVTEVLFRELVRESFIVQEQNPFIRQIYREDLLELLLRKLPEGKKQELEDADSNFLRPIIEEAQKQGWMISAEPEAIVGLLRGVGLLAMQKRHFKAGMYEETMSLMIELLLQGLIVKPPQ